MFRLAFADRELAYDIYYYFYNKIVIKDNKLTVIELKDHINNILDQIFKNKYTLKSERPKNFYINIEDFYLYGDELGWNLDDISSLALYNQMMHTEQFIDGKVINKTMVYIVEINDPHTKLDQCSIRILDININDRILIDTESFK